MIGRAEFLVIKSMYEGISDEDKNKALTLAPFHAMSAICERACARPGDGSAYRDMMAGLRKLIASTGEVASDEAIAYMVQLCVFNMFLDQLRGGHGLTQFRWPISQEEIARRMAAVELCAMRGEANSHGGSVTMFRAIYGEAMTPVRSICTSVTHGTVDIYTPPLSYWQGEGRAPFCPLCGRPLTMGD